MCESVLRECVRAILLAERMEAASGAKAVLLKIDNEPYHMLPVEELDERELELAELMTMRGLVKRLPANRRFPERFVLSSSGSHAIGTFEFTTLHDEEPEIRNARRQGTLKSQKW